MDRFELASPALHYKMLAGKRVLPIQTDREHVADVLDRMGGSAERIDQIREGFADDDNLVQEATKHRLANVRAVNVLREMRGAEPINEDLSIRENLGLPPSQEEGQ